MKKNENKKEILQKGSNNANYYDRNLEHVQGNAFTGEQVRVVRNCQTEHPMTDEEIERNWDEMEQQARILRNAYPDEVIYAENLPRKLQISSGGGNNQVVSQKNQEGSISRISVDRISENERVQVAMYNDNGNQIVGKDNIRKEVRRREAEWEQWKREGKLQEVSRTYTVAGKNIKVKFRGIPGRMYSQNTIQNFLPVFGISEEEVSRVAPIQSSSQITRDDSMDIDEKQEKNKLEKLKHYRVDSKPTKYYNKFPTRLVAVFIVLSALAISGIVFAKSKLGKNKKK